MSKESSTSEVESLVEATELTDADSTDASATDEAVTDEAVTDEAVTDEAVTDEAAADDVGSDEAVDTDEVEDAAERRPGALRRGLSWCGRRWVSVVVAAALVLSAGGAGAVYWWIYRPDQQTNPAAEKQVVAAAKDGTVALLSYAPDTLDKDLTNAKSHLTGEFLKYYSQFTDNIVKPAASKKGVKTEASVVRAAVSEMHPDRAVVLVFVNQVTTSKDRPEPALATSAVMVTMVKSSDHWLISEFKPV